MKNKKLITGLISVLLISSIGQTFANTELNSDKATMPYIGNQILSDYFYDNNWIIEDVKYNQNNFYTKKIKLGISIKDEDKEKIENYFLILSRNNYGNYYPMDLKENSNGTEVILNNDEQFETIIRYDIKGKEIPKEFIINTSEIKGKLKDFYGESFSPILFAKMKDGSEKKLNNSNSYVFISSDENENKNNFLNELMYSSGKQPLYFYENNNKLDEIFLKIKENKGKEYYSFLNTIENKINLKIEQIEFDKNIKIKNINSEEGFKDYLNEYIEINSNLNFYLMINRKISLEKENDLFNERILELFGNEY